MNSAEIRQSFLDYFAKQDHAITPSSPLMPESPNLLFTNAGMNQFVPYFLGEKKAPFHRAADTQKCIRAGGKHNDLDDVGFDTYHHTYFEMLGNWSFGNYFKKESLNWGWELLTGVWGFPKERLYATVYKPDPSKGDPASFDQEAYDIWVDIFKREGLDPAVHIKYGNKKDNFWMMGDTGPCGPCSEIHVDLTEKGDTKGSLVNSSSSRCIEIWNHVFMEFNATSDGKFVPLPAKNVDTGMGYDRVAGIIAGTKKFTDFSAEPSNYNSDTFATIFAEIQKYSAKRYTGTVPVKREGLSEQQQTDVAFRVVADHLRCVSFAIADGILPSNEGRNYVIRRILRRGIMYGRKLNLQVGDLSRLSSIIVKIFGAFFPELTRNKDTIAKVILGEEESFGRTLAKGMQKFEEAATQGKITGPAAFELYDTYGFPLDLTEVLATERGLSVDKAGFEAEMDKQRERARAAQKKSDVVVQSGSSFKTSFVGYDAANLTAFPAKVLASESDKYIITDASPFYAEMGGQLGDYGTLEYNGQRIEVTDAKFDANGQLLHLIKQGDVPAGAEVTLSVNLSRRGNIARHHSATHLLDWALREKLGNHIRQAGSMVAPDRLRFDFSHFEAVSPETLRSMESDINAKIIENAPIKAYEVPFAQKPADVVAVFGEKYGETVRVVDIGGYSKELCGGTHAAATGEIGLFKIVSECAIAAGTRRIEAVVGQAAFSLAQTQTEALKAASVALNCPAEEVPSKVAALQAKARELEAALKANRVKELQVLKSQLIAKAEKFANLPFVKAVVEGCSAEDLKQLSALLLGDLKECAIILASAFEDKANVLAASSKGAQAAGFNAGNIIKELTTALDGRGGGKPDFAQGSGKAVDKLTQVISAYGIKVSA